MPDRWLEICNLILDLRPDVPGSHAFRHVVGDASNPNEEATSVLVLEQPYATAIDEAVQEWTIGRPLRTLEPPAAAWLANRCTAGATFALKHTNRGDDQTKAVLPEPVCSTENAIKFLLTVWWKRDGYREFYFALLLEHFGFV